LRYQVIVEAVPGAAEALAALQAAVAAGTPYEVALLDYQMPGMDGEALSCAIKSDPTLAATAIVLLSSGGGHGYVSRLLAAGAEAVLVKPAHREQLLRTLARARGCLAEPDATPQPLAADEVNPAQHGRLRVLVAEDSQINQKVVTRMLERLDCTVDLAADGKQAVKMAVAGAYDLLFMDCQMPEMDGYQATANIRRLQPGQHTPIIALTANAMGGDRERCLAAGMDDYIAKPIKLADLAAALHKWVPAEALES
jgi:CheY-like chemotaxis protein